MSKLFNYRTRLLDVSADGALRHQNTATRCRGQLHGVVNILFPLICRQTMRMTTSFVDHHPLFVQEPFAAAALVTLYGSVEVLAFLGPRKKFFWRIIAFRLATCPLVDLARLIVVLCL